MEKDKEKCLINCWVKFISINKTELINNEIESKLKKDINYNEFLKLEFLYNFAKNIFELSITDTIELNNFFNEIKDQNSFKTVKIPKEFFLFFNKLYCHIENFFFQKFKNEFPKNLKILFGYFQKTERNYFDYELEKNIFIIFKIIFIIKFLEFLFEDSKGIIFFFKLRKKEKRGFYIF